jgi:hypothetical protein
MLTSSFLLLFAVATGAGGPELSRVAQQAQAPEPFVIVPLRVHILASRELPFCDCKLRDSDVTRVVGKLNMIWRPAGIYFGLESIVHDQATNSDRVRVLARISGGLPLNDLQLLLPKENRAFDGFQAYFFHELPLNGRYLGDDIVIVQEQAQLNEVKGGIDEPLPRVLGFTLGTALALEPRAAPLSSLLALGTTGIELEKRDIERARRVAQTVKGAMTRPNVESALAASLKAGKTDRVKLLRGWLTDMDTPRARPTAAGRKRDAV